MMVNESYHSTRPTDINESDGWLSEDYIDDDGIKRKKYWTVAQWRKRQARMLMAKKVRKHEKPYTWRLGYNHIIGQYQSSDCPTLSGSSLNRSLKIKPKEAKLFIDQPKKEPFQEPHKFSKRSRGKVKDKATAFWRSTPRDRTFATLTFIQDLPHQAAVKILNKFLTVLRKERPGLQYLWVAELQHANNNRIHFHILLNRRLPIGRYNALWVLQQYNAGLTGKTKHGDIIGYEKVYDAYWQDVKENYKEKRVQQLLNPFDIEKAYNINGLSFYLTQYVTKQGGNDEFSCLNWHCSRRVSKLFTKEVVGPSAFAYMMSFSNVSFSRKTGEIFAEPKVIQRPFFTMCYVNNKGAPLKRLTRMEKVNKWLLGGFETDGITELDDDLYRKIICKT